MDNGLKRSLSMTQVIAMAAGGMIAAWMVEIKYWFELTGSGAILALILCALLVLPLCLIYSEMTTMMPYAGGENIWISNAFGWDAGWLCCWFVLLLYVMAMPTVSYGIASMLGYLYPITFIQTKIIAAVILVIWFFLTRKELKFIAKMQNVLFWSTLVVSIVASIIFILSGSWKFSNLSPWFPSGCKGFSAAIALLIMKFIGFDLVPQLSEEINFPKKDLWKAFVGSLAFTVLIYGMAIFAVGGIVSQQWILETDIVDPRVADVINMHWLGIVIVIMGTGTCLTTLSGFWVCASRTLYGASLQKQFTSKLSKINKYGQPTTANIIVGILSIYFTVFAPDEWVNYIYTIYGAAAGVVYLLVSLSFLKLRKSHSEWDRPYKLKCGVFFGIISSLFSLYVIFVSVKTMDKAAWGVLLLYIALGIPFWLYAKHMQTKNPEEWSQNIISPDNKKDIA